MCTRIFLIALILYVDNFKVYGFSEKLSGESILYGLASLTKNYGKNESSQCMEQLNALYTGVDDRHRWALKVIDVSGHPENSFLNGNNLWIGSHSHCMDISNKRPLQINHERVAYPSQTAFDYPPYPLKFVKIFLKHNLTLQLHVQLPFDFTIQVGLCVPKSCTNGELFDLFEYYLSEKFLNIQQIYDLSLKVDRVKTLEEDPRFMLYLPKTIILLIALAIVLLLTVIGTIYDIKRHFREKTLGQHYMQNIIGKVKGKQITDIELVKIRKESPNKKNEPVILEILRCFSVYSNTKALADTSVGPNSVTCIHGIRFFGMVWVCLIHSVFFQADYTTDPSYAYRISEDFLSQTFTNSTYSVDTYLFISGFLLAYLYYKSKKMDEKACFSKNISEFFVMFFHRLLRLTPPYLMLILLCDVTYTYFRRTSSLESSETPDILCSEYWWRNILYINNLYPRKEMCLSWSWYMSLDTQAFAVSAVLLIISSYAFNFAVFSLFCLILGSVVVTAYKAYSIGYIPTMDEQFVNLDGIYDLPWNRIGPYLVGVVAGYLLVKRLHSKLVLGTVKKVILWILFPLLNLWILFTLYTRQVSVEFSAIYMGISRTLWGVGLAWLVIACHTGNGVAINKFLSFRGWIPLSRLTFCAYLLNPLIVASIFLGSESVFNATKCGYVMSLMGITTVTFLAAFIFSILFESPFILLTKILLKKLSSPRSKKSNANIPEKPQ